jgi:hypothetical protein
MRYLLIIFLLCLIPGFSSAQSSSDDQKYVYPPTCFEIKNTAPYTVFGEVSTAEDQNDQGQVITHRAVFRLKEGETEPVCSTGPFFERTRLRITLRTIFPIFECKTMVYQDAEILIRGEIKRDGTTETWIDCL